MTDINPRYRSIYKYKITGNTYQDSHKQDSEPKLSDFCTAKKICSKPNVVQKRYDCLPVENIIVIDIYPE